MNQRSDERHFTGRHMLLIMLAFFGVIITVNLTMATLANTSWTGLIVKNTYVASQQFNGKVQAAREQDALGWTGDMVFAGGAFRYALADANGAPVALTRSEAVFRRPVEESHDRTVALEPAGAGAVAAVVDLADGIWIVEVAAQAGLATPYRDIRRVTLRGGVPQ
jgi:nitrogen fixation protein FixH